MPSTNSTISHKSYPQDLKEYYEVRSYFGTSVWIHCFYDVSIDIAGAVKKCWAKAEQMQRYMNVYGEPMEGSLSWLNRQGTQGVRVQEDVYKIIKKSILSSKLTHGAFDLTIFPFVELWKEAVKLGRIPDEKLLQSFKERVGYQNILLQEPNLVFLMKKGVMIDLGSPASGYFCDEVANILDANKIQHFMVDGGGEIFCRGLEMGKRPWRVGVQDPFNKNNLTTTIELLDRGISTSGNYEKFSTIGTEKFAHIMVELESERRNMEAIFDSTQVGLLLVDSKLKVKRLNQVVLDIGGQDSLSVVDRQPGDALSCIYAKETEEGCGQAEPCRNCLVRSTAEKIVKNGQAVRGAEICHTIRTAKGEHKVLWFEVNASPIDIKGERHILFSLANITDRKAIDVQRQESLRFLQVLIDAMPNPVFHKDVHGIYTGCNNAFLEVLGKERQDVIGKSVFDLSPRELAEVYHAMDMELINTPGTQLYESKVKYADGSLRNIIFNKASFTDAKGKVVGLIGVMVDITERQKKVDEELRQKRELEVFYKASVGREERIIALKKEVELLKKELGR